VSSPQRQPDTLAILRAVEAAGEASRKDAADLRELVGLKFDAVDARMARVERDLAKGEIKDTATSREIAEMRLAFGELRDLVEIKADGQVDRIAQASSSGAAQGSSMGAMSALKGITGQVQVNRILGGFALAIVTITQGQTVFNWIIALFGGNPGGPE